MQSLQIYLSSAIEGFPLGYPPHFQSTHPTNASDTVQFSPLFPSCKSVPPLDLNIREYNYGMYPFSYGINSVTPHSLRRCLMQEETQLVDALYLESRSDLIFSHTHGPFHGSWDFSKMFLQNLEQDIVKVLRGSRDKVKDLKRYLKAAKVMKVSEKYRSHMCECFLEIVMDNCPEDSDLVKNLFEVFGDCFIRWILEDEDPHLLKFVLRHVQKTKRQLFGPGTQIICPLAHSIQYGRLKYIKILLAYGFSPKDSLPCLNSFFPLRYHSMDYIPREDIDQTRLLLLVQLLHLHKESRMDPQLRAYPELGANPESYSEAVRLLWRSIPDRFLDKHELETTFRYEFYQYRIGHEHELRQAFSFYRNAIGEDVGQIRTLAHRCRCVIRDSMRKNKGLPHGIETLDLPEKFKSYLRLEF